MTTVGFIGLGAMGLPMAKNLAAHGFTVRGFDMRPTAVDALAQAGGVPTASAAEVAREEPIDWAGAEVDTSERQVRVGYTVAFDADDDVSRWLVAEATERGLNPIELIKELVREAHQRATSAGRTA